MPLERIPVPSQRELHEALRRFYEQYAFEEEEEEEEDEAEYDDEEEFSRFPPHWRPRRWCRFVVEGACCPHGNRCTFAHHESEFLGAPAGPRGSKIYWGHGLSGDSTGAPGQVICWLLSGSSWRFHSAVPGPVVYALCCWEACGDSTGAVLGQVICSLLGKPVEIHRCIFWRRFTFPSLCLVPLARQCRILWRIHSRSFGTRCSCPLLLRLCLWPAQELWIIPQ